MTLFCERVRNAAGATVASSRMAILTAIELRIAFHAQGAAIVQKKNLREQRRSKRGTGGLKMAEYIKREAAIRVVNGKSSLTMTRSGLIDSISSLPAADVAPVVHARWITRSDKGIISMTHPYMCSRCWRVEMNKEPYCNCGAKMDGGDGNASM